MDTAAEQKPSHTSAASSRPRTGRSFMPWAILALLILVAFVGLALMDHSDQQRSFNQVGSGQVTISSSGFEPATIKVKKGKTVTWTNADYSMHAIASDRSDLQLDSEGSLDRGDSFTFSFSQTGTYRYSDPLHTNGYKGTVIVE